jgi:hypothetical protein
MISSVATLRNKMLELIDGARALNGGCALE